MVMNQQRASSTRVADGEQAVVAQDGRLVVAEGVGDALALLDVEHDAGVVVEQAVVLEEDAGVLGERVEQAGRAPRTPCRRPSGSGRRR